MPIFVNFTKASTFYRFFFLIIRFLWLFQTIIRVFHSKTFVFTSTIFSIFGIKKPAAETNGRFFVFF